MSLIVNKNTSCKRPNHFGHELKMIVVKDQEEQHENFHLFNKNSKKSYPLYFEKSHLIFT